MYWISKTIQSLPFFEQEDIKEPYWKVISDLIIRIVCYRIIGAFVNYTFSMWNDIGSHLFFFIYLVRRRFVQHTKLAIIKASSPKSVFIKSFLRIGNIKINKFFNVLKEQSSVLRKLCMATETNSLEHYDQTMFDFNRFVQRWHSIFVLLFN